MRVLRKGGRPFLLFPGVRRAARAALELYPAQRTVARGLRRALQGLFHLGLYPLTSRVDIVIPNGSELGVFLTGLRPGQPPSFCGFAGNPNAAGQRFVFLLLDAACRPETVVKAGFGEEARRLIVRESAFLQEHGGSCNLPSITRTLTGGSVAAFALPYFPPPAKRSLVPGEIGPLLSRWLAPGKTGHITDTPQWHRLQTACSSPGLPRLQTALAARAVRPCLYHGDFAAWNIRQSAAGPVVLDWERGETDGPPGWDWFHYVVQDEILVRKRSPREVLRSLRELCSGPDFTAYAHAAGIRGLEIELLHAYVLYARDVIRPGEGMPGLQGLLAEIERGQNKSAAL